MIPSNLCRLIQQPKKARYPRKLPCSLSPSRLNNNIANLVIRHFRHYKWHKRSQYEHQKNNLFIHHRNQ
ncbi:hypothetical protein [Rubritalea tangerina]|uniref:hypothetical protein n=1 Tax=Rubritalea tangerina TaxID=430798 RepID=UPI00360B48BA